MRGGAPVDRDDPRPDVPRQEVSDAMNTNVRWAIGILGIVSALSMTTPAWSDDRGAHRRDAPWSHWRGPADTRHDWERREWERREWERGRAAAHWRFEHGHGWRYAYAPGAWSTPYVWWWTNGRTVLRPI